MAAASVRIFNAIKQKRSLYYGSTKWFGLNNSSSAIVHSVRHFSGKFRYFSMQMWCEVMRGHVNLKHFLFGVDV